MKDYKAVVFDIDGTLYDQKNLPVYLILSDIPGMMLLSSERKCRKTLSGVSFASADDYYSALFDLIAKDRGVSAQKVSDWFWKRYMPNMVKVIRKHFPAREKLTELVGAFRAKGMKVAVFSDYAMAQQKLSALGCNPSLFDAVLEAPSVGGLKPCAESFRNVCRNLSCDFSEVLMIGDKVSTDGGAMDAGMDFIHIIRDESKRTPGEIGYTQMTWSQLLQEMGL